MTQTRNRITDSVRSIESPAGDGVAAMVPTLTGTLTGTVDLCAVSFDRLRRSTVVGALVKSVQRTVPDFAPAREQHAELARVAALSYGYQNDVDILGSAVAQFGLAAVAGATAERGPLAQLAGILAEVDLPLRALDDDESLVLAALHVAPSGAGLEMLREALPGVAVQDAVRSLRATGMLHLTSVPPGESAGSRLRAHLRVAARPCAALAAAQSQVCLPAVQLAHAVHLQSYLWRLGKELSTDATKDTFDEAVLEIPNVRSNVHALIEAGRAPQAIGLLEAAAAVCARVGGRDLLQGEVLALLRSHDPTDGEELARLADLVTTVLAAGGERELAQLYAAELPAADHRLVLLDDDLGPDATIEALRMLVDQNGASRGGGEASIHLVALLLARGDVEEADVRSRALLCEATRMGDDQTAAAALVCRAAAAADAADAARFAERAVGKLRGLGVPATVGALRWVVEALATHRRRNRCEDLAGLLGAISSADLPHPDVGTAAPRVLGELEDRLIGTLGPSSTVRLERGCASAAFVDEVLSLVRPGMVRATPAVQETVVGDGHALGRSGLTARESQVATLVADGLTNRQIGARLHISEWTVINHMRAVMRKLDCASRVQVACVVRQVQDPLGAPA